MNDSYRATDGERAEIRRRLQSPEVAEELAFDELNDLMAEAPGGDNHGFRKGDSADPARRRHRLDLSQEAHVVEDTPELEIFDDPSEHGMVAHRGVLTAEEVKWLDSESVVMAIEYQLGATIEEVKSAYSSGRPSPEAKALRRVMDAKFLDLSENGGNMTLLANILGFYIKDNGQCEAMSKALNRARERRGE